MREKDEGGGREMAEMGKRLEKNMREDEFQ